MNLQIIERQTTEVINLLPESVFLVAAAKTRTYDEVQTAVRAGIRILGYNYVQEAERMFRLIGKSVQWHMIGHLQRNKVKKAISLFDMIETLDSYLLAELVDQQCAIENKIMPVLIEINSGKESSKTGVLPEDAHELVKKISTLSHLQVQGLMTMGPYLGDPENSRPYFKITRELFERLKTENIPNVDMRYLSMGMSHDYHIAIEEGANIVRIGTKLFGEYRRS